MKTTGIFAPGLIAFGLAGLMAMPLMAQTGPEPETGAQKAYIGNKDGRGAQSLTPQGKAIMREARQKGQDPAQRGALQEARNKVMAIVSADKLDVAALRNAMEAERKLVDQQHARRQAAMLDAFQKLSAADRKAFVTGARAGRDQLKQRMERRNMDRARET